MSELLPVVVEQPRDLIVCFGFDLAKRRRQPWHVAHGLAQGLAARGRAVTIATDVAAEDDRSADYIVHGCGRLMQRGRPYIFTTASSPVIAAALLASLELIVAGDDRRAHLQALIARLRAGLDGLPWRLLPSLTAIQPLVIGDNQAAVALAERLLAQGLWVPAIRPPTVPAGTARLRISLSAAHTTAQVDALLAALRDCVDRAA